MTLHTLPYYPTLTYMDMCKKYKESFCIFYSRQPTIRRKINALLHNLLDFSKLFTLVHHLETNSSQDEAWIRHYTNRFLLNGGS